MGGQTALNIAVALAKNGALEYGVVNWSCYQQLKKRKIVNCLKRRWIGLVVCPRGTAKSVDEAKAIAQQIGTYPLIIRPAFTMGGGGRLAYNQEEFDGSSRYRQPSVPNLD